MKSNPTSLQSIVDSPKQILLAELAPFGASATKLRDDAKKFKGKVHALGISDNRNKIGMSALSAASLVLSEQVDPILHMITRDRNRIAMVSDFLGAKALGIDNILCTTGTHQTLNQFKAAKNVFDIDVIQQLQLFNGISRDETATVGNQSFEETGPLCLGAAASPHADPIELQLIKLKKKIASGASFVITTPVFDVEQFAVWWKEVTQAGLEKQVAIIAGIQPLPTLRYTKDLASKRPNPRIPGAIINRMAQTGSDEDARKEGVAIALETIEHLKNSDGLRGFEIRGDEDADLAIEVIEKSGLRAS